MTTRKVSKKCTVNVTWYSKQTYEADFGTGLHRYPVKQRRTPQEIVFEDGADLCKKLSHSVPPGLWGGVLASFPEDHHLAAVQEIRRFCTLYSQYPHNMTLLDFQTNVDVLCEVIIGYLTADLPDDKEVSINFIVELTERVSRDYDDIKQQCNLYSVQFTQFDSAFKAWSSALAISAA
jgi:hypothetical protein